MSTKPINANTAQTPKQRIHNFQDIIHLNTLKTTIYDTNCNITFRQHVSTTNVNDHIQYTTFRVLLIGANATNITNNIL